MIIDEKSFNKIASVVLIGVLALLTFLILKPIIISSLFALILAFIFYPVYKKVYSLTKSKNFSAVLICFILLAIIFVPLIFLIPILIRQSFAIYSFIQGEDFLAPIHAFIEKIFASEDISKNIIVSLNNSTAYLTNYFLEKIASVFINSPVIFLQVIIIFFVFFFGLRDGDKLVDYIQSLSPLSKESEKKIFVQFKDITHSVIYGQIVIGIIQGILTGIALFVFGIPNAFVLTVVSIFLGILPIIGPSLVWIPVVIYLLALGKGASALILLVYGIFVASGIDNILRPLIVGKKTKINSGVILVSMVGGFLVFGILGLIVGPLIIAYLLLILETYRKTKDKKYEEIFIHKEEK